MTRDQQYYTIVRQHARALWDSINALEALQREYTALAYGNAPDGTPPGLEDGEGAHAGLTRAEVGAVVFDTTDALRALLNTGHGTNLARLL